MKTSEFEAKTIDEAIEKACLEFQVPRSKLQIDILADGSSGFLGLGSKKARIRAGVLSIEAAVDALFTDEPSAFRTPVMEEKTGAKDARPRPEPAPVSPLTTAEIAEITARAKAFLEGLLSRMDLPFRRVLTDDSTDDRIILTVEGENGGLLIGKRGQNIDAIQYIVNKAVNRTGQEKKMIVVDTEDYRKRREESLMAMAERLGEKVKKTKKAVTIGHMNAHDRRIIHLALQKDEQLTTKSRGESDLRKIVIMPSKKGSH